MCSTAYFSCLQRDDRSDYTFTVLSSPSTTSVMICSMSKISQSIVAIVLLIAAGIFAAWQWYEYQTDIAAAEEVLHSHAEGLFHAVVGSIRSHRRLGAFFDQQIQIILDELTTSQDVLAIRINDQDNNPLFVAGTPDLIPSNSEGRLTAKGYVYSGSFQIAPLATGGPVGGVRGYGWGRWIRGMQSERASPFASGGTFYATMVLDRGRFDTYVQRAFAARVGSCLTAWTTLLLLGLTFRSSVRAVRAEHARHLAELQARHFEELSQAASGLAHETRNPLGLIRGRAQQMAQRAAPSSPMAADTRIIIEECDRLAARLTQFILFAKPFTLHLSEVDPDTVIEEVTLLLEPDCQSKNVRWVHQRATQPITVMADRELLRQAIFNLLHNAVKYTRSDSEVTIMTRNDGPHVIIEILDQGPGVEPDDVPKLFMPYFSTDPGGTGLGLSLVRKIAIAHGWDVTFSPAPGGGSAFRLLIPQNGQKRVGK